MENQSQLEQFLARVQASESAVGVIGLGYVGLPMAVAVAESGFACLGFDVKPEVVDGVNVGRSHVLDVEDESLAPLIKGGRLAATSDPRRLKECDAISICVPTPLNKMKDPDLSFVVSAAEQIRECLRPGQLVILESTTFPGTTREVILDILDGNGLQVGQDFFLCYSPERVDPGNADWTIQNTPKVIGGVTTACSQAGKSLYEKIFDKLIAVSSPEAAELTKVYENTFRMINIALANELAQACDRLGVDVWEVIEAAASKPFGFMKFTPGPGLGGHCIPLDPHYLSWKMRTLAYKTRMIELASEINSEMPGFVVRKVSEALNRCERSVRGSRILIVGVTYKRDIDDVRESPAVEIIHLLDRMGAQMAYYDPFCPRLDLTEYVSHPLVLESSPLSPAVLSGSDIVVIVTDHSGMDYQSIVDHSRLVIDTRGVLRGLQGNARIVPLAGRIPNPEAEQVDAR